MSRILISGASGLLGAAVVSSFEARGHEAVRLVRHTAASAGELQWDPMRAVSPALVSGFDVVIHLSGENVAGRWTRAKKHRIRESRVVSTKNLSQALASAKTAPKIFVCASAIGYYGNRGEEILTEESSAGAGFFPEVCSEWEAATDPAAKAGIRVVNLRTGIVLGRGGGALKQMLLPFKLGLGGKIGDGSQYYSWIHVDDFVAAVQHISQPEPIDGPVNMTAPNPVTNAEFTRALANALNRPALLPIPAFAARLAFGELADEGLLASARVLPKELLDHGFNFRFSELSTALEDLVKS